MYVYSTKSNPTEAKFTEKWSDVQPLKEAGELALYKKVADTTEGKEFIANRSGFREKGNTDQKAWCEFVQHLTVYKNDKGFFTRRSAKNDDEWVTAFIPVYFGKDVSVPSIDGKRDILCKGHWFCSYSGKLAICIDEYAEQVDLNTL